jgi:taurine transport system substrate-binding protein
MKKKTLAKIGVFAAAAALAVVSAACGSNDDSSKSGDASGLPDKIVIGYQNIPNGDLIVKHDGLLEAAFGDSVSIEWKLFDSGGSVNEAILAGAIDIGLVGSSPASRGISSGIEYQIPWIFDVIGKAEALAVKGGINSIADLKGKTIATPFASTSHYSLLAALEEAGLSESDVKVIDSEPDAILAAWQQGDIDGAYVWNPVLAKLTADGGKVLVTSEDLSKKGKTTYDLAVVTTSFATKYPAAVQIWLDQQNAAITKIRNDADSAAKSIAAELNIPEADAKQQLSELIFLDASEQAGAEYLGGGLARNLFAAAQFNLKLGKIESVKEESAYNAAILTTFASAAK